MRTCWAAKVGVSVVVPGGPPGLGSPFWQILVSAPTSRTKGQMQHHEAQMCKVCSTMFMQAWEG